MRPGADSQVVAKPPIIQVVLRFLIGEGPCGDLILIQARLGQLMGARVLYVGQQIVVW